MTSFRSGLLSFSRFSRRATICSFLLAAAAPGLIAAPNSQSRPSSKAPAAALPPSIDIARSLGDAFASVVERVGPSVVVITVDRGGEKEKDEDFEGAQDESPNPFDFFHRNPRQPGPPSNPFENETMGSGFIVRADGYIYTNNHVIQGANKIKVKLKDGRIFDAHVVGIPDEKTDVAVIKINAKDLPAVELGDSDAIRPGEWTIAIGAPFNLDYSVTVGVLSGKVRDRLGATIYEEYLQTQATINPGNSGGPLLDINGKVVGINTLIKTRPGAGFSFYNANVGFAIPIKLAQKVGNLLITKGKVDRPWIGVDIRTLEEASEIKDSIRGVTRGVLVMAIRPETPAYDSNLKPGDVITAIDEVQVQTARELQKQVLEKQIGQSVQLSVIRDGKPIQVSLKTGLQPSTQPVNFPSSNTSPKVAPGQAFGLTLEPLTRALIDQYNLVEKHGLLVVDVDENSGAARAGLLPGMVLTEANNRRLTSVNEFKDLLKKSDPKRGVWLQVSKDGVKTFVIFKPSSPGFPLPE
jgi:serine protease Do